MSTWWSTSRSAWRPDLVAGLAALGCALGAAGPAPAPAQGVPPVESGRFEIRMAGRAVGTETFAIRSQGDEFMAVGRITVESGAEALRSVELGLRCDARSLPRRYELRAIEGPRRNIVASRSGSRLRLTTSTGEGERLTEFLANDRLLLVERNVAHHYYFVVRRLRAAPRGGEPSLEILIPADGRTVPLNVRSTASETLRVGDRSVEAVRYELSLGNQPTLVWVEANGDRILRVVDPERGWSATRMAEE